MAWDREPAITVVSPAVGEARQILRAYFDDVAARYYGRQATEEEIAAAMRDDPSDDLELPGGLLVVARGEGSVLGCAGLRLLPGPDRRGYPGFRGSRGPQVRAGLAAP